MLMFHWLYSWDCELHRKGNFCRCNLALSFAINYTWKNSRLFQMKLFLQLRYHVGLKLGGLRLGTSRWCCPVSVSLTYAPLSAVHFVSNQVFSNVCGRSTMKQCFPICAGKCVHFHRHFKAHSCRFLSHFPSFRIHPLTPQLCYSWPIIVVIIFIT